MLTIRRQQKLVLDACTRERFIRRAIAHLRHVFPELTPSRTDADLRVLVEQGLARAQTYGITQEREAVQFVDLMVALGPEFDRHPDNAWMVSILKRQDLGQNDRMEMVFRMLQERRQDTGGGSGSPGARA